jgi:hypothetical protein
MRVDGQYVALLVLLLYISVLVVKAYMIGVVWNAYQYLHLCNSAVVRFTVNDIGMIYMDVPSSNPDAEVQNRFLFRLRSHEFLFSYFCHQTTKLQRNFHHHILDHHQRIIPNKITLSGHDCDWQHCIMRKYCVHFVRLIFV